jgi:hypothetical protein
MISFVASVRGIGVGWVGALAGALGLVVLEPATGVADDTVVGVELVPTELRQAASSMERRMERTTAFGRRGNLQ